MNRITGILCVFTLLGSIQAQDRATARFPVRRVVLYKNGVGYFEHLGRVKENQDISIQFTSGQLNDVLKSLTVLDLGSGRITGVTYGSAAPLDRRIGDLHLPVNEKTTLTEFLGALRGARLEVRSGTTTAVGRLLSVERKTRMGAGATLEVDYLSLVNETGEVQTTELAPGFSVRILDRGLAGRVDRYMDLLSSAREADTRRMTVATSGAGERPLFVSYVSEVPVWKTTYRVVLSSKQRPLLQGWAVVDNTVGEDWDKVTLSLVAGAPQSFIQKLSQPYYSHRPVVPLPESFSAAPQTHESTLFAGGGILAGLVTDPTGAGVAQAVVKALDEGGAVVGETTTSASGSYSFRSLPEGRLKIEIGASGFKTTVISGVMLTTARPREVNAQLELGSVTQTVEVASLAAELQASAS